MVRVESEKIEICEDEEELDDKLREMKKKVNKTKKFSSTVTSLKLLERVNLSSERTKRILFKNGLVMSNLKDERAAISRKSRERMLKSGGGLESSKVQSHAI